MVSFEREAAVLLITLVFIVIFIGFTIFVKIFTKRLATGNNPLKKYHRNPGSVTLSQDEKRALNIGAVLTETNHEFYNSLQALKHSAVTYQKVILSEWWGISSPEKAEEVLEWLKNKGHRRIFGVILANASAALEREPSFDDFLEACEQAGLPVIDERIQKKYQREAGLVEKHLDTLYAIHSKMSDEEIDRLIEKHKEMFHDGKTFLLCIKIYRTVFEKYSDYVRFTCNLRKSLGKLRNHGFADADVGFYRINPAAWDMGRLVNVARWCYGCGYIAENKAWEYIFHAEKESANCYTNWAAFGNAYVIGRALCGGENGLLDTSMNIVEGLLNDENSPWRLTPLM